MRFISSISRLINGGVMSNGVKSVVVVEQPQMIIWFDQLSIDDVSKVGGKNASLGEMICQLTAKGIRVPTGFATTAAAFWAFIDENGLRAKIVDLLRGLNPDNSNMLKKVGAAIRKMILQGDFSQRFQQEVERAYQKMEQDYGYGADHGHGVAVADRRKDFSVAVRSSATAEDLPTASFAGQQETYLNVRSYHELLVALKKVYASLYTDRAIAYRIHNNFDHSKVALSAGVQYMVRSDLACSGVMFSIDTESGFDQVVLINAAYGLGETVVQGAVNPDEYCVFKPSLAQNKYAILHKNLGAKAIKAVYAVGKRQGSGVGRGGTNAAAASLQTIKTVKVEQAARDKFVLSDDEVHVLARYAVIIHEHYRKPMDIEWAKDGKSGELFIVQARPETVESRDKHLAIDQYKLGEKGTVLVSGLSIGHKIGQGKAKILKSVKEMAKINTGDILITDMTDPDWEPIMKRAAAIVTNRGGRTCHAAIIARELGVPAVVGCGNATAAIPDKSDVTVSCAAGETGFVYAGKVPFAVEHINIEKMPQINTKIMMNVANPDAAFELRMLPNSGVGLARLEFIISDKIGLHPKALLNFAKQPPALKKEIKNKIKGYHDPVEFYVAKLAEGIATIAAAFYPKPVIVRMSDFKSNEYANLLGGKVYEPTEENPMIGFRGASRYADDAFRDCFALECRAVKWLRDEMGLTNIWVMIPFCRTPEEGKSVLQVLKANGLQSGQNDLKVICMCEIPSNALQANEFLDIFDGFSIGSNDLTQLTLGLDRDSALVAKLFNERNNAVKALISMAIRACNERQKYIGICGQAPSDYPDFAAWLVEQKIQSISLNPDSVISMWLHLAK
jgi:pyruvate, water dikinase